MVDVSSQLVARNESEYCQCLTAIMTTWGHVRCLFASVTPETVYQPSLSRHPVKWQCTASSLVIIHSWFLLKISNSRAPLPEGLLRKALTCLCPQMDCHYSLSHMSCSYSSYPKPNINPTCSCPISLWSILILYYICLGLVSGLFPCCYLILLFEVQYY
jgi:hypothetical protein